MDFEWDEDKNRSNLAKHGVGFELAASFLWDRAIIRADTRRDYGEPRFIARGPALDGGGYHIAFTLRSTNVRIISIRRFNTKDYVRYGT
jgi:uncharacterized protein